MSYMPLLVMVAILFVITILLYIAEKFLINYGECKISVVQEEEKREFVVQGGDTLLAALSENKIDISSSCAGKATCGYCKVKVLNGGGEILPTEEMFMSRQEKIANMRLACQVKVRNDIEIYIPDFLEIIKEMVIKRTYDPSLRWHFNMGRDMPEITEDELMQKKLAPSQMQRVKELEEEFKNMEGAIVPLLQKISKTYNYLPEEILRHIARDLNIPISLIYRIATFYHSFSLTPVGKNVITVCTGTACHVKGAENIVSFLEYELKIKRGGTTEDMQFSLKTVRCIGCCGLAPVLKVGEEIHGLMNEKKAGELIKMYRNR